MNFPPAFERVAQGGHEPKELGREDMEVSRNRLVPLVFFNQQPTTRGGVDYM